LNKRVWHRIFPLAGLKHPFFHLTPDLQFDWVTGRAPACQFVYGAKTTGTPGFFSSMRQTPTHGEGTACSGLAESGS
jgi:hypothetical protein